MNIWQGNTVLVTGGAGFVASFIIDDLLSQHKKVIVPWNTTKPGALKHCSKKIEWRKGNLLDADFCNSITQECDVVLHFASYRKNVQFHIEHAEEVIHNNVSMSHNLANACKLNNGKPVVFCSSILASEKNRIDRKQDGYCQAKIACESIWQQYGNETNQPVLIIRPTNIYGPRETIHKQGNMIPALIAKCKEDDALVVWGRGIQERSFLYAPDLAKALQISLQNNCTGIAEIHPNIQYNIKDVATIIRNAVNPTMAIKFDTSKPEGGIKIRLDDLPGALKTYNWTDLQTGIKTIV